MFWREREVSCPWLVPSRRPLRAFSVAISEFVYTVHSSVWEAISKEPTMENSRRPMMKKKVM